ncbi:MAG: site-specific DNA-methyltransferase [Anaerolineae bacterium]|jgi:DNA modification methylase|nr:site-specific DNA-methyltransferase [Anaerolineae bacterium]
MINQLYHGDSLDILTTLPERSVDLVFADPPYNLQLQQDLWRPNMTRVDAVDDDWDHFESFEQYDHFTRAWLEATGRVMSDHATIWISGTYHNIFRVGVILQDLGFWILNTITWEKVNAMPNFRGTRLKNDVEFIIWAKKSEKARYTFNHHAMKRYNGGKQLGSVWQIPACGGPERLKDPSGKKLHSTQKPEALLERIVIASSTIGDRVLDPFSGTGTTAAVAKRLHRHFIGIERDPIYWAASKARVESVIPLPLNDPIFDAPIRPPKIAFHQLVARGQLTIGEPLYLDSPEVTAFICPDGRLQVADQVGSIHQLASRLKGVPSCNGWMCWYYQASDGQKHPINALRWESSQ